MVDASIHGAPGWAQRLRQTLDQWRYLKFGVVGASGTGVNLAVLYLCQEWLLQGIDATQRLYASLLLAIALATLNNFFWNRLWTWSDRQGDGVAGPSVSRQLLRYCLASWLGTAVQYVLTLWLATHMHYMLGNVLAIVAASFVNYFANDWWTFQRLPRTVPLEELRRRYERITLILLLLALWVYAFDLGGENIPRNGDELVYAHIAFKTWWQVLHGGGWLPLASDLGHMRNTKPPLLFWQAMAVGWLGLEWQLLWLRLPSLLYTAANTALVVWAAQRLSALPSARRPEVLSARSVGYVAGLFFLAFFSTYRYGRPYLTSAIETFWMGLPVWGLLAWQCRASLGDDRWVPGAGGSHAAGASAPRAMGWFVLAGLCFGMVALYKSFVLIAPLAATLWLALCAWQPRAWRRWFVGTTLSTLVGMALFALWFVLDPDPQAVWREFVIGENLGKMDQGGPSYWQTALVGGFSIWWQALALPQNAFLLAPIVLVLLVDGLRRAPQTWRQWRGAAGAASGPPTGDARATLWIYLLVVSVFFLLPSQRSARYLIPLMPVVAVLCATQLGRWPAWVQRLSLGLSTLLSLAAMGLLGLFLWAGWRIDLYPLWGRLGLLLVLLLQALALVRLFVSITRRRDTTRVHTAWVWLLGWVISLYAWFGLLSAPLHTAGNRYSDATRSHLLGARLAVPSYFNGDFERWRFLLPTVAHIEPYAADGSVPLPELLARYDAVVVHGRFHDAAPDCAALGCRLVEQRLALRGRHPPGEINASALRTPESVLFWREYLLLPQR